MGAAAMGGGAAAVGGLAVGLGMAWFGEQRGSDAVSEATRAKMSAMFMEDEVLPDTTLDDTVSAWRRPWPPRRARPPPRRRSRRSRRRRSTTGGEAFSRAFVSLLGVRVLVV